MKIAAVIAEYNPFHAGHAYHLRRTRELSGADYVVAVMDGNFTQRGEAAVLEKRQRAEAALRCGADAVVELPGLFAVRPAQVFARAGVALAQAIGADVLSFGCETADVGLLRAALAAEERARPRIRAALAAGESYARARGEAVAAELGVEPEALNRPNLALALEYLRAMDELGAPMEPLAVERVGAYHSGDLDVPYPSAGAIRAALRRGEDVRPFLPGGPADARWMRPMDALDELTMYVMRAYSPNALADVCDVSEGLERRVCKLSTKCISRMQLLRELKCKRYTYAHLSRVLAQALTGVTKQLAAAHPLPEYARLIGARRDAGPLLREMKARARLPMVSDAAQLMGNPIFECECRMTDLFMLLAPAPEDRRAGVECTGKYISMMPQKSADF